MLVFLGKEVPFDRKFFDEIFLNLKNVSVATLMSLAGCYLIDRFSYIFLLHIFGEVLKYYGGILLLVSVFMCYDYVKNAGISKLRLVVFGVPYCAVLVLFYLIGISKSGFLW